eukprot:jgi/Chlat1/6085/Chrsp4S06350
MALLFLFPAWLRAMVLVLGTAAMLLVLLSTPPVVLPGRNWQLARTCRDPTSSQHATLDMDASSTAVPRLPWKGRHTGDDEDDNGDDGDLGPETRARRARFLPACEPSALPGTGWGLHRTLGSVRGGIKSTGDVGQALPRGFTTDYVKDGPPMSAVLNNVCVENDGHEWQYIFVGRNESWVEVDPEKKLHGKEWEYLFENAGAVPKVRFVRSRAEEGVLPANAAWMAGTSVRLAVRSTNAGHHIMENVLHEAAVQLPEFRERVGKIDHFVAEARFTRFEDPKYALPAHLTRAVMEITPEADLLTIPMGAMTCFETLVVNQMWLWTLPEAQTPRAPGHMYTQDQVDAALALFREATFKYLQMQTPRLSLPLQGEEVCVSVYGRKYVYHRTLLNADEIGEAVARAVRATAAKYGQPGVRTRITSLDDVEGAHILCPTDPKHQPEFRDQVLAFAHTDVYVGSHGANGALALFLPRCATFLEIVSECSHGLWSAAPTHAHAIHVRSAFINGEPHAADAADRPNIKITLVEKDYSDYFGFPAGSNVSSTCEGLRKGIGYKGYVYTPDFVADGEGVAAWVAAAVRDMVDPDAATQERLRDTCKG